MRKAWCFCFLLPGLLAGCDSGPPGGRPPGGVRDARRHRSAAQPEPVRVQAHGLGHARGPELLSYLKPRSATPWPAAICASQRPSPVEVDVAAPESSVPFWIRDQDFSEHRRDARESRRSLAPLPQGLFPPDGLASGSTASTAARRPTMSSSSARPREPAAPGGSITLDRGAEGCWRKVVATAGRECGAARLSRPFAAMPGSLEGSVLLQPFHDRRHSTLLANGRVWKTRVPSGSLPDQVTIAVRIRSCPRAGLELANRAGRPGHGHPDPPRAVRGGRERRAHGPRPDRDAGGGRHLHPGSLRQPAQ